MNKKSLMNIWSKASEFLSVIETKKQYKQSVKLLDMLIDEIGEDEKHPLSSLIDTIGILIADYEDKHIKEFTNNPIENLKYLMNEQGLTQSDLPEVGSQGVVSEILNGKRELNKNQIKGLSKRFKVSPSVFFEDFVEDEAA